LRDGVRPMRQPSINNVKPWLSHDVTKVADLARTLAFQPLQSLGRWPAGRAPLPIHSITYFTTHISIPSRPICHKVSSSPPRAHLQSSTTPHLLGNPLGERNGLLLGGNGAFDLPTDPKNIGPWISRRVCVGKKGGIWPR